MRALVVVVKGVGWVVVEGTRAVTFLGGGGTDDDDDMREMCHG